MTGGGGRGGGGGRAKLQGSEIFFQQICLGLKLLTNIWVGLKLIFR